jgi:hypothetical protein
MVSILDSKTNGIAIRIAIKINTMIAIILKIFFIVLNWGLKVASI